MVAVAGVEPAS